MSFLVAHAEHSHVELFCFATIDLNRSSTFAFELEIAGAGAGTLPGLLSPQHKHFAWATSLSAIHESHTHFDCFCLATIDLKTSSTVAVAPLLDEIVAFGLSVDADEAVAGDSWLAPQHTHLVAVFSFDAKHDEHDHFADCCETIFLKISSAAGAAVVVDAFVGTASDFLGSGGAGDDFDIDDDFICLITIGSLNL